MPRLPGFIGGSYADLTRPVDAQETINLFAEKVESGQGANDLILRKVPGRTIYATLADSPTRGSFEINGRVFVAAGVSLYELQQGLSTGSWVRVGTIAADDFDAKFASNGSGGNQLFIVSGGRGYISGIVPGTVATLTEIGGGFPSGNARGAAFLDGYFFTTSGFSVYASELEDGLTWSAASVAQRSIAGDDLVTIKEDGHRLLWLVGNQTSEPWYDAGQRPFPLTPVANSFMMNGTGARDSVVRFDNTVFMVGKNENGDRFGLIVAGGQAAQRITTHAVENAWRGYARVDDAKAWTYTEMGHSFVVVTFPSANATWAYDGSTQMWNRLGSWNIAKARYDADLASSHVLAFGGKHLVGSRNGPYVFEQSLDIYADNGHPIRWMRRSPHVSNMRQWMMYDSFELVAEMGRALLVDADSDAVDPQVSMTYSDDGGYTWGSQRTRSLGLAGEYRTRLIWNRLGRSRDRVFEVNGSSKTPMTLIDAMVDVRA